MIHVGKKKLWEGKEHLLGLFFCSTWQLKKDSPIFERSHMEYYNIFWLIDWCLTSSEQFFQDENIWKFKRHGTQNKERWWVGMDNFASVTGLLWTTVTLGSLTCGEGGNLSTRDLGFIYVSSTGWVGCEFIHPAQPTDALSSRRSSRSHLYTPGFPRGSIFFVKCEFIPLPTVSKNFQNTKWD